MILSDALLQKILGAALENGADFAEVFVENTYSSRLFLKDSKPSEAMVGRLCGAGIRLFYGTEQVYTYTNDLSERSLLETAKAAAAAISGASVIDLVPLHRQVFDNIHRYGTKAWELNKEDKISYLQRLDKAARQHSSAVSQVIAGLIETVQEVQIANSLGVSGHEQRQYSNASIEVIAEKDGQREQGYERKGALASSDFFAALNFEDIAKTASSRALQNLTASYAPAGDMPVVIDNGFGGVIFHEACGHGLETTAIAKNASVFCGLMGEKIADECVTAIDDGTIANNYGSIMIDDEGRRSQKTTLIENGVLTSYLVDELGSRKTGYTPTGSGRRQNYRYPPTSRMRNTYIAAGKTRIEEMIADIDEGLFAKQMGGGSVTPGTGAYNFVVSEGYRIKNGQIMEPVKGASLIGTGIDTLKNIVKVGPNLELAPGTCGSISGNVPVTVGQPPILVQRLTVGGRT